jgi:ribosomal protein L13
MKFQTYTPTESAILDGRKWYVVDATGLNLGRMAAQIALILRGKHKPIFAPHIDTGDFVIVINAEKLSVTGDRMETKLYRRHSQYRTGSEGYAAPQQTGSADDQETESVQGRRTSARSTKARSAGNPGGKEVTCPYNITKAWGAAKKQAPACVCSPVVTVR